MRPTRAILGLLALALPLCVGTARADHINYTDALDAHVKDQGITFKLHTGSLNTAQRDAITLAAEGWETDIGKAEGGLDFTKTTWTGDPYNSVTGWADDPFPGSNRLVWEGAFVASWGCNSLEAVACSFKRHNKDGSDPRHIKDLDITFNYVVDWTTGADQSECSGNDAITASESDPTAHQATVALHEFGHWQHLIDVTAGGTIMNRAFSQGCASFPLNGDEHAVDYLYGIPSGHAHVGQP